MNDPVWVSGASGFIGRRLVRALLEKGLKVRAFDIVNCAESLANNQNLDWIQGDISDKASVKSSLSGCKTIFHLAAMVGDWGTKEQHERITVQGTRNLFESIVELELRPVVVLSSSIVVYGEALGSQRCHEGLPLGSTFGPYSESKQAQERIAMAFHQQGIDVRVVRPANVYGAGSKPWVDLLSEQLQKGLPSLVAGGDFDAGLVHVDNVVEVLLLAAERGASGQIYNVADEEGVTWSRYMRDIAEFSDAPKPISIPRILAYGVARLAETGFGFLRLESRPPITLESLNLIGSSHRIDMEKTKRELGYKPVRLYQDGIEEVEQYLSQL
jgi:nucleoside-diphosphate-sugar epimerase